MHDTYLLANISKSLNDICKKRMFPNVSKEDILHYSFVEYSIVDNNEIALIQF